MKTKITTTTENVIEFFELFSNLSADKQKEWLKDFDEMLTSFSPDNAEFFAMLRGYLVELQNKTEKHNEN